MALTGNERRRGGTPTTLVVHIALLGAAGALSFATRGLDRWDPRTAAVVAVFTIVSGLTWVETSALRVKVSGSFLGLMLGAILLGGGPASMIGALAVPVIWLRNREAPHYLLNNFVTYAWFPLAGGTAFHLAVRGFAVPASAPAYYLLVFFAFVVALLVNFLGVVGYGCSRDGSSLRQKVRDVLVPVLPAELFSALLTMGAVWAAVHAGVVGVALLGLTLLIFQFLVAELLRSKQRGDELQRRSTTDELTGLANRERFRDRIRAEIATCGRTATPFAVMLLDLDRFKEINDTLGHHYGDEVLRVLGPRLADALGPNGLVARLGGDEFALLPGLRTADRGDLEHAAAQIARIVEEPVDIEGMALGVGASIGIARFPLDGHDPHSLLRCADIAMYAAKEAHTDSKLYNSDYDRHSIGRLNVLSDFRRALDGDQIIVHYQPIVDVTDTGVRAAEALVRWEHPKHGLLSPAAFVQAVEQTGLIGALTRHVLEQAIAQCAAWRRSGRQLGVAVNLSVRNLLDRQLPRELERLLSLYGLPPEALQLEITESMIMSDPDRSRRVVSGISDLGVRLSVDDFGTGYSSLANLRRLPISELKIDRSFVSPMLRDNSDLVIVRSTINLAHELGMNVIAEGVEDAATLHTLDSLGCDLAQGYHISRPLPAETFAAWMRSVAALTSATPALPAADPGHAYRAADADRADIPRASRTAGPRASQTAPDSRAAQAEEAPAIAGASAASNRSTAVEAHEPPFQTIEKR